MEEKKGKSTFVLSFGNSEEMGKYFNSGMPATAGMVLRPSPLPLGVESRHKFLNNRIFQVLLIVLQCLVNQVDPYYFT